MHNGGGCGREAKAQPVSVVSAGHALSRLEFEALLRDHPGTLETRPQLTREGKYRESRNAIFGSTQSQVLQLSGKSLTFFIGDGPKPMADCAMSLDVAVAVEPPVKAPRAISHLQAGLIARWAHRHEGNRIGQQPTRIGADRRTGSR